VQGVLTVSIAAIYENGVFRPLIPPDLPERTPVELGVRQTHGNPAWSWRSLGLVTYVAPDFDVTPEEFHQSAAN
jgi:hypothetical protein